MLFGKKVSKKVLTCQENGGKGSDLIPFWGLTEREDMVKIERIVPMYPFSERLIKILSNIFITPFLSL
jgi:hypothetical protein